MDGSPNGDFGIMVMLLLGSLAATLLAATTAVFYLVIDSHKARVVHYVVLAILVGLNVGLALFAPQIFAGLLFGGVGRAEDDIPLLKVARIVPFLWLLAFLAPVVRRVRRKQ